MQTSYPDSTSTRTVYDDLGRVQFSISARGITNAFGYDSGRPSGECHQWTRNRRPNVSSSASTRTGTNSTSRTRAGAVTTNVFDALNRQVQVLYPDGTKASSGFDAAGRRVADTNQDGIVTLFGYDGAGRLISVTNAVGKPSRPSPATITMRWAT